MSTSSRASPCTVDMKAAGPTRTDEISRRTFCGGLLFTSTALVLAPRELKAQIGARPAEIAYPPMKIRGAEAVLPGGYLHFSYPLAQDSAILIRTNDGEYFAYSRKCAHMGCSIDFNRRRGCLECPCHTGSYDAKTGFVIFGPPPRPLDSIVLQMRAGGEVWAVGKTIAVAEEKVK